MRPVFVAARGGVWPGWLSAWIHPTEEHPYWRGDVTYTVAGETVTMFNGRTATGNFRYVNWVPADALTPRDLPGEDWPEVPVYRPAGRR